MTVDSAVGGYAIALNLSLGGAFCLFGALAMTMRRGLARGIRTPIPDDQSADVVTRLGRSIMRVEHGSIPVYAFILKVFLCLGIALIVAAGLVALVIWL